MASIINKLIVWIDKLNEAVGRLASWLTTTMVILVCFDVLFRRIFRDTQTWIMELEWHFFALIFLFGAGYTLKHNRHVRVDLFYHNFSEREKAWVNLLGSLLFLLPWTLLVIIFAFDFAWASFLIRETSPNPGGLPARYLIKFAVAGGFFLLFLQGVSEALKAVKVLSSGMDKK